MKKFNVYIMCGIPGSGKSTYIKNNLSDIPVISRDKIRAELGYTKSVDEKAVLSKEQEERVTEYENARIDLYCSYCKSFVIDDINTGRFRKSLIERLRRYNCNIIGINIKTPLETCIKRRKSQISADILTKIQNNTKYISTDEVDELLNIE